MKKYVLAFASNTNQLDQFNSVLRQFSGQEYIVQTLYIDIFNNTFNLACLPAIIDEFRDKNKEIDRVIIVSNIRQIIFTWYRLYNDLVDDFIYVIDREMDIINNGAFMDFLRQLSEFKSIENDVLEGKIYLNINFDNYPEILPFLITGSNYAYFEDFKFFDYNSWEPKSRVNKCYQYNGMIYSSTQDFDPNKDVTVVMDNLTLADDFSVDNMVAYPYIFIYMQIQAANLKLNMWTYAKNYTNSPYKSRIYNDILSYINSGRVSFLERMYFLSLAVVLEPEDDVLSQLLLHALIDDREHMDYHYHVLYNFEFYFANNHLPKYEGYYKDFALEIKRLSQFYTKDLPITKLLPSPNQRIAFHVDQLIETFHSPSKMIMDYVLKIHQLYPQYEIRIFVEENFALKTDNVCLCYYYFSDRSEKMKDNTIEYLRDNNIHVYYSNTEKCKRDRTRDIIEKIVDFNPDCIITTSNISLAIAKLYELYPIVYVDMGGFLSTCPADIYLFSNPDVIVDQNKKFNLIDDEIIVHYQGGIDFPAPVGIKTRSDYNLTEEQFVMVTVGSRLDVDLNEAFIAEICNFLMKHHDAVWLVVGSRPIPIFAELYQDLLDSQQICTLIFEKDLMGLYGICDVYVNPVRSGGGVSIIWAMERGLPIITLNDPENIALVYLGAENAIGNETGHYGLALERHYLDQDFRREIGNKMHERTKQFSLDSAMENLIKYAEQAREHFSQRASL